MCLIEGPGLEHRWIWLVFLTSVWAVAVAFDRWILFDLATVVDDLRHVGLQGLSRQVRSQICLFGWTASCKMVYFGFDWCWSNLVESTLLILFCLLLLIQRSVWLGFWVSKFLLALLSISINNILPLLFVSRWPVFSSSSYFCVWRLGLPAVLGKISCRRR